MTVPVFHHPPFSGAFTSPFEGTFTGKSGFIPTELSSLVLWLDAKSGITASGNPLRVSSWLDRSGNNNNAIQNTGGKQPFFVLAGINGFPSLRWSDPDMGGVETMEIQDANSLDLTSDFTFYIVQDNLGTFAAGINMLAKNVDAGYRFLMDSEIKLQTKVSDGTTQTDISAVATNENPRIWEIHYKVGGNINFTENGVELGVVQANTLTGITANTATLFVGSKDGVSDFWFGDIGQILLFNKLLTIDERNQVGNYLGAQYNIPWIDIVPNPDDLLGLVLWLDARRGIILTGSDVSTWADQSGNNHSALQTEASRRPLFQATSFNGFPTLEFDSSTDENMNIFDDPTLNLNSSFTFYVVMKSVALSSDRYIISRNPTMGYEIFMDNSESEKVSVTIQDSMGSETTTSTDAPTDSADIILEVHYEVGGIVNFTQSGVPLGAPKFNTRDSINQSNTPIFIGSFNGIASPFEGEMAQIVLYNRLLTLDERNIVGNSLATSYGLTWTDIQPVTPAALPGLVLWLDGSVGKTLINNRVQQWDDQSGNGNNAVQNEDFRRPGVVQFGPNNLDALRFIRTAGTLIDVSPDSTLDFTGSFSFFAVLSVEFENGGIFNKNGTSGYQWFFGPGLVLEITASASTGGPQNLKGSAVPAFTPIIVEVNFEVGGSNTVKFTQNGVSLGERTNTLANIDGTTDILRIGDSPFLPYEGNIAQLIIYNRLLNTNERNFIGQYLGDTYGLPWTNIT